MVGTIANGALATIIQNVPAAANLPIVLQNGREFFIQNNKLIEKITSGSGSALKEISNSEAEDLVLRFIDSSTVTEVQNEFGDTVLQALPIGFDDLRNFPVSEDGSTIIDDDGVEIKSSGATILDLAIKEAIERQKANPDTPLLIGKNFKIKDSNGKEISIPNISLPESEITDAAKAAAEKVARQAAQVGGGSAGIGGIGSSVANLASSNISGLLQKALIVSAAGGIAKIAMGDISPEPIPTFEEPSDGGNGDGGEGN